MDYTIVGGAWSLASKAPARGPAWCGGDLVRDLCPCEGQDALPAAWRDPGQGPGLPGRDIECPPSNAGPGDLPPNDAGAEMPYPEARGRTGRMFFKTLEQAAVRLRVLADQLSCPSL